MFFRLHDTPTLNTEGLRTLSHRGFYAGVALVQWLAAYGISLLASGGTPSRWAMLGDMWLSVLAYGVLMADDGSDRRRLLLQTTLWSVFMGSVMLVAWHQPNMLYQAPHTVHLRGLMPNELGWFGVALVSLWWHVAAFRARSWRLEPNTMFVAFWSTTLLVLVVPLVVGLGHGCLALLLGVVGHMVPGWYHVLPEGLQNLLVAAVSPGLYAAAFWLLKAYPAWLNTTLRGLVRLMRTLLVPWTMLTLGWGLVGWTKGFPLGMVLTVVMVWWCGVYGALPPGDGYAKRPHAFRVLVQLGWVGVLGMVAAVFVSILHQHGFTHGLGWVAWVLVGWAMLVSWRCWQRPCWSDRAVFSGTQVLGAGWLLVLVWMICTHQPSWVSDDLTFPTPSILHGFEQRSTP